jgi:L-aminopeptidase/D-esterase-like protein
MGYQACLNASNKPVTEGSIGAGTGATVGKYYGISNCMKGGIGSAIIKIADLIVGALAVVNSFGDILNPETSEIIAGTLDNEKKSLLIQIGC